MDDPSSLSPSKNDIRPTKKRGRHGTRMKQLCLHENGVKTPNDFDPRTKIPLEENRKKFKSHVGSIARNKVSILEEYWDNVDSKVEDQIWEDIMV